MRERSLLRSFNWAIEGVVYAVRTQRNMRIHLIAAVAALGAAVYFKVTRTEFMVLLFTVTAVLLAELLNTAIEATIDLVAATYDPLAKIAKDVAAAAVLVASVAAIVVGYLVFFDRIVPFTHGTISRVLAAPIHVTVLALFATVAVVVFAKALGGRGSFVRGGMPSGHTAVAAALLTAITLISRNALVATLGALMVLLVAQSRVEAGFHSVAETVAGGALGLLVTVLLFQVFGLGRMW